MKMKCKRCKTKFSKPGALLFSPPWGSKPKLVEKYHICLLCFNELIEEFDGFDYVRIEKDAD